jgi:hypothetical protein
MLVHENMGSSSIIFFRRGDRQITLQRRRPWPAQHALLAAIAMAIATGCGGIDPIEVGAPIATTEGTASAEASSSVPEHGQSLSVTQGTAAVCPSGTGLVGQYATWCGKVNLHTQGSGWASDSDCTSGCNINTVSYCQKFWPGATTQQLFSVTPSDTKIWQDAGCSGGYPRVAQQQYACCVPQFACVLDPGMLDARITFARRVTLAQTFIATRDGSLTQIIHGLQTIPTVSTVTSYDLLVTTTTPFGLPTWTGGSTGTVLYKATGLGVSTMATSGVVNGVVTIPSGQEPQLTGGTKYALILVPASPTGLMYWRGNSSTASYPGGSAYELNGTTWSVPGIGPKDHGFMLNGLCQ